MNLLQFQLGVGVNKYVAPSLGEEEEAIHQTGKNPFRL